MSDIVFYVVFKSLKFNLMNPAETLNVGTDALMSICLLFSDHKVQIS